jgi:hypothetical protein
LYLNGRTQLRTPALHKARERWAKVEQKSLSIENHIFTKRKAMIIERTNKEVILRLPSNTKLDDLQSIADIFTFKKIAQKSKATQAEADALAKAAKKGRWARTKSRLGL